MVVQERQLALGELPGYVGEHGQAAKHHPLVYDGHAGIRPYRPGPDERVVRVDGVSSRIGDDERLPAIDDLGTEGQGVGHRATGTTHTDLGHVGLEAGRDQVDHDDGCPGGDMET